MFGCGWIEIDVTALDVPHAFSPVTVYPEGAEGLKATPLVTVVPPVQV